MTAQMELPSRAPTSSRSSARAAPTHSRLRNTASRLRPRRSPTWIWATRSSSGSPSARTIRTSPSAPSSGTCGSSGRPPERSCPTATTSAACSRSSTSERAPPGDPARRAAVRGAELDARRQGADLQSQRRAAGWGGLYRFDLVTRQVDADRHRCRQSEQQRSRAVVRRNDARDQRSEPVRRRTARPSTPCRSAAGRPNGSRRRRRRISTAGRPTASSCVFTGGRNNEFDIYRIPADGSGPEVSLTERRAWTTARSSRRTGSTSISIRCGAGQCRSGG